jgi:hypothetical protein
VTPDLEKPPLSGPFGRLDPSLPQVFGRYLLVQRLSRGGMGEIFLAKHGLAGFEKLAVIKKVLPHLAADASFISRFVDEAQVAIKLQHVNVAQVFEVGRVGTEYFLALEYIEGRDLRRTLAVLGHKRQRMPADLALFIARELANGLAYAHRRTAADGSLLNLVHCDISPPNVLVSFEGETKVIDFGIAKSVMRETATDPKVGFGKFGYMAPEQLIRGGVVDLRTDLYAAGVVLFELLTGTRLYEAGPEPDYRGLAKKVARGEHPLPSEIDAALAPYDDLVATALRPRPEDRYQSAAELRDAIQHCLVAVNPTISTDQLGAYMRGLFADEMAAQRELHDRVASAHLADFEDQLQDQTTSTISFALAALPLAAPDATGQVPLRRRSTGRTPVVRRATTPVPAVAKPSPALDTGAPPTDLLDKLGDDELEPAATIAMTARTRPRRRPRWPLAVAGVAVIAGGFAIGRLVGGRSPAPVAPRVVDQRAISVEPLPRPAEPAPVAADPAPAPVAADPATTADPEAIEMLPADPRPAPPRRHPAVPARPPVKHDPPPAPAAPTREQLGQKFQQIRREYDAYKARYGARLEREWGELATFIQYMPASDDDAGRREAARRLETFRGRMRE